MSKLNLFGKKLETCSTKPLTGAYRNGCCETGPNDIGTHTVCAIVTDEFLEFSKKMGNDLTKDYPQYNFKGFFNIYIQVKSRKKHNQEFLSLLLQE